MLRFVFNFALFGLVFYMMYLYLPDTFSTLVGWADATVDYGRDFYQQMMDQMAGDGGQTSLRR